MKKPVVVALTLVVLLISCACCIGVGYLSQQDQDHYAPLAIACDGRAVVGAAAYQPGTPSRIVYFERFGTNWSEANTAVPTSIRGAGVTDTAIVACAADDTTQQVVEQCCFQQTVIGIGVPNSETCYPRLRVARRVELRIAATGALLAARDVQGPMPNTCDSWVGRRPSASHFEGDEPGLDQFAEFYRDPTTIVPAVVPAPTVPTVPPVAPTK